MVVSFIKFQVLYANSLQQCFDVYCNITDYTHILFKNLYRFIAAIDYVLLKIADMSLVIDTAKVKESSCALKENDELSFSSPRAYRMRPGTLMVRKATRGPEDAVKNKMLDEKALEDLYCNRLWKSQLPKERSWETIYEEPVFVAKTNSVKVQSVSRVKRLVNFSAEGVGPSPAKTKRRQQRARQYGWRAFSKKRLHDAEVVLFDKIGRLDSELDCSEEEHSLAAEPHGVLCYRDNVKVTEMKTEPTEI